MERLSPLVQGDGHSDHYIAKACMCLIFIYYLQTKGIPTKTRQHCDLEERPNMCFFKQVT